MILPDALDHVQDLLATLASAVICGGTLWGLVRIAVRVRRRGAGGGSLMQPFEEIWHPIAYEARIEVELQQERPAPSPLPGGRLV